MESMGRVQMLRSTNRDVAISLLGRSGCWASGFCSGQRGIAGLRAYMTWSFTGHFSIKRHHYRYVRVFGLVPP